jgi:hypothetical protein
VDAIAVGAVTVYASVSVNPAGAATAADGAAAETPSAPPRTTFTP